MEGKVALVTGAGSGIGKAAAVLLIAEVTDAQAMGRLVNMVFWFAAMDMVCRVLSV
jgi:NAD(P)-dependent dehydrogenase (short-subunit alcohol dehydrogenase family)